MKQECLLLFSFSFNGSRHMEWAMQLCVIVSLRQLGMRVGGCTRSQIFRCWALWLWISLLSFALKSIVPVPLQLSEEWVRHWTVILLGNSRYRVASSACNPNCGRAIVIGSPNGGFCEALDPQMEDSVKRWIPTSRTLKRWIPTLRTLWSVGSPNGGFCEALDPYIEDSEALDRNMAEGSGVSWNWNWDVQAVLSRLLCHCVDSIKCKSLRWAWNGDAKQLCPSIKEMYPSTHNKGISWNDRTEPIGIDDYPTECIPDGMPSMVYVFRAEHESAVWIEWEYCVPDGTVWNCRVVCWASLITYFHVKPAIWKGSTITIEQRDLPFV